MMTYLVWKKGNNITTFNISTYNNFEDLMEEILIFKPPKNAKIIMAVEAEKAKEIFKSRTI